VPIVSAHFHSLQPNGVASRDVKTVYFSEPVTGLPKPVFYRLPTGGERR